MTDTKDAFNNHLELNLQEDKSTKRTADESNEITEQHEQPEAKRTKKENEEIV